MTPQLGNRQKSNTPVEEIPVEMEDSEDYHDDDFESSDGSAALQKISVSASGKLPPLAGSYPHGAAEKSLS